MIGTTPAVLAQKMADANDRPVHVTTTFSPASAGNDPRNPWLDGGDDRPRVIITEGDMEFEFFLDNEGAIAEMVPWALDGGNVMPPEMLLHLVNFLFWIVNGMADPRVAAVEQNIRKPKSNGRREAADPAETR